MSKNSTSGEELITEMDKNFKSFIKLLLTSLGRAGFAVDRKCTLVEQRMRNISLKTSGEIEAENKGR
jgi:hypothetical protein